MNHYSLYINVLLDQSAAFDKVCHHVLFSRLGTLLYLSGKVFDSFRSYLEQHCQKVSVHIMLSDVKNLKDIFDQFINM